MGTDNDAVLERIFCLLSDRLEADPYSRDGSFARDRTLIGRDGVYSHRARCAERHPEQVFDSPENSSFNKHFFAN